MQPPSPTFECDYGHDRREHRHRCRCCSKIIDAGERVLMVRLQRKSWALHVGCADKLNSDAGWTWRDSFEAWGTSHLRACGWKIPEHPMARPGAIKNAA
jgi:hypothetical protein